MITNRYYQAIGCYDTVEAHKRYNLIDICTSRLFVVICNNHSATYSSSNDSEFRLISGMHIFCLAKANGVMYEPKKNKRAIWQVWQGRNEHYCVGVRI